MIDAIIQFQSYNEEYRDFRSLMLLLHENGYPSLVIGPLKQILNDLSTHFSIDLSKTNSLLGSSGEILMKKEPEVYFFLDEHREIVLTEEGKILVTLKVCCLAPDENTGRSEIEKITETIEKTAKLPGVSLTWGSLSQQGSEEKISKIVKGLSTNGKLLTDIETKKVCKHLRKDKARKILLGLIRIEGFTIPLDFVQYLHDKYGIGKKALMRKIKSLVDCGAVSPQVRLICPSCGELSSGFSVSLGLEELEGKIFCSQCGVPYDLKKRREAFSVNQNTRQALKQGLWLEEFIANVLTDFGCMKVQVGVMVDTLEIDVLAIKHGEIILVECKAGDVNFTDLTIFSHKVRTINPDQAVIVTTSKVLPNAKKEIESIKKREEIEIMQFEGNLKEIGEKLGKMTERIEERHCKNWVNSIFSGMFIELHYVQARRRLERAARIQKR